MTIPSLRFKCPVCNKVEYHIDDGPHYCVCAGKGSTRPKWDLRSPVKKMRTKTYSTQTRMVKLDD